MKKKFIAVSVLICALALGSTTLTSCVDDNESASVTAIRDAKANQLNALAKLSEEQATATKIQAEAKAAIDNAIAAYKQALAEQEQAKADIAKARLQIDIEAAKAQAEANLTRQKADLEKAKAELAAQLDALADEQLATANHIMSKMDELIKEIHNLNTEIIDYQFKKTNAEYQLENDSIQMIKEQNENNAKIAIQEALIAEYKKYSQEDYEKAEEAAIAAEQEVTVLSAQFDELQAKYNQASNDSYSAWSNLNNTPFMQNVDQNYLKRVRPDNKDYVIDFEDGTIANGTIYYNPKFEIDNDKVESLADDIENQKHTISVYTLTIAEANKSIETTKATQAYKDAVAKVDAAQKKYNEATTAADKESAWVELQNAQTALESLTSRDEQIIEDNTQWKEGAEEYLARLEKTKEYINDTKAYEEYSKKYDEYIKLRDAAEDALIALTKFDHTYTIKQNLAWNLRYIANQTTDYATLIEGCETQINNIKKDNEALRTVKDNNELVAYYQEKIDKLTADIEVKNKLYAQYEAALTQVFDGQTPEVPETPEEGGEETPAE